MISCLVLKKAMILLQLPLPELLPMSKKSVISLRKTADMTSRSSQRSRTSRVLTTSTASLKLQMVSWSPVVIWVLKFRLKTYRLSRRISLQRYTVPANRLSQLLRCWIPWSKIRVRHVLRPLTLPMRSIRAQVRSCFPVRLLPVNTQLKHLRQWLKLQFVQKLMLTTINSSALLQKIMLQM